MKYHLFFHKIDKAFTLIPNQILLFSHREPLCLAVKDSYLTLHMKFNVFLSRIKFLYFCRIGIKIITNTYGSRFLSESYYKCQICAANLGTHLQIRLFTHITSLVTLCL